MAATSLGCMWGSWAFHVTAVRRRWTVAVRSNPPRKAEISGRRATGRGARRPPSWVLDPLHDERRTVLAELVDGGHRVAALGQVGHDGRLAGE